MFYIKLLELVSCKTIQQVTSKSHNFPQNGRFGQRMQKNSINLKNLITKREKSKTTYVITTVLFFFPFAPVTFTRAEIGTSGLEPTISIFIGLPSKSTLLYFLRAENASLLLVYKTSAEPCHQVINIRNSCPERTLTNQNCNRQ